MLQRQSRIHEIVHVQIILIWINGNVALGLLAHLLTQSQAVTALVLQLAPPGLFQPVWTNAHRVPSADSTLWIIVKKQNKKTNI